MIVSDGSQRLSRFGSCPFGVCSDSDGGYAAFGVSADVLACVSEAQKGNFSRICEQKVINACAAGMVSEADVAPYSCKAASSTFVGKTGCASSASSQGLGPAPGGDTYEQAVSTFSTADLVMAVAWASFRDAAGNVSAAAKAAASAVLSKASGGDCTSQGDVTRSLAFWHAAGRPGGAGGSGAGAALQAAVDAANAACASLPTEGLRAACRAKVEEAKAKGEQAVNDTIGKITGGDGGGGGDGGLPGEESTGFPWWGYLLVAAVVAKAAKVW